MKEQKAQFPILIAENDSGDAQMIKRGLEEVGFTNPIHFIPDGKSVVAYLKGEEPYSDRNKYKFPRVLLVGLELPKMSGFDVLAWLKNHEECNVIPRIVLSRSTDPQHIDHAYKLGVNSYIEIPATFDRLVSKLQLVLDYWSMCEKPTLPAKC